MSKGRRCTLSGRALAYNVLRCRFDVQNHKIPLSTKDCPVRDLPIEVLVGNIAGSLVELTPRGLLFGDVWAYREEKLLFIYIF